MSLKNLLNSIRAYSKLPTSVSEQSVLCQSVLQELPRIKETLERILTENILPFWHPQVIDSEDGGYRLNHDINGRWKRRANKRIVTQARTVWFFSRLFNSSYGSNKHLEAAKHGYEFLCDRMWDKEFGGFYWEVDSSGNATKPHKHLYGQAFALYALSEYAPASKDSRAAELAQELFNLLERTAHDARYGGYQEFFRRDWGAVPEDVNYLNATPDTKLMNTHLHLLEAITGYYLLTKDRTAWERLIELIFIQSNAVVRKTVGACTDKHHRDWTPLQGAGNERVSYGHALENIWLLTRACNLVGMPNSLLLDLYRTLFNYALQYGFDQKKGGFYYIGSFNKPADKRDKIWWVQAEGLVSALQMYRLTGEEVYFNCFSGTLDWIVRHQVDWQHGDWYAQVAENGKPSGDKAGAWKSPYHNGRAMIKCLELLSSLSEAKA